MKEYSQNDFPMMEKTAKNLEWKRSRFFWMTDVCLKILIESKNATLLGGDN